MKSKFMAVAVAGALAITTGASMADDTTDTNAWPGAWYVLPTIGVMHTDSDLNAKDYNFSYGIRVGKELSEKWDVQLGLTHSSATEDSNNYTGGKYKQNLLGIDAMYMFSRDKFRPFLLAGIGIANNNIHYGGAAGFPNANGNKNSWMANVGVGAQYDFTDNLGVQADIRQVYSRAKADGGLFGSDRHDTIGNTYLNVGVVFKFGEPKHVAATEPAPAPEPAVEEKAEPAAEAPPPAPPPEPEQKSAPAAVGPDEPVIQKVAIQAEVLFDFNKAIVKPAGKKILDSDVVEKMKANPQVELLLITGHADRIGSEQYNQKLSERRAESVKQYLVSQGIEEQRLHTEGKGKTEPVVQCPGPRSQKVIKCLQPNRRVVLEIEAQRATEK